MHRLRQGRPSSRYLRESILKRAGSGRRAAGAAIALLLALGGTGCSAVKSGDKRPTAADGSAGPPAGARHGNNSTPSLPLLAGQWVAFVDGRPLSVKSPTSVKAPFEPWTVQTHASGIVRIASTIYVALNGWGVVTLAEVSAPGDSPPVFRLYEDRDRFGERTINGFYAAKDGLILHLYRNTVFKTPDPRSTPISYVRFDPSVGRLEPVVLPLNREGWEAIEVVRTSKGRWAITWKKTEGDKVSFRYTLYDPAGGGSRAIDRKAFLSTYEFIDIAEAPEGLQAISAAAREGSSGKTVIHLLVRNESGGRVKRYRSGSAQLLESGDADLKTIPIVRTEGAYLALLSGGRIVRYPVADTSSVETSASSRAPTETLMLPALPEGYAYTNLWTNGKLFVVSWEQQRFADVGAAGLLITELPPPTEGISSNRTSTTDGHPDR